MTDAGWIHESSPFHRGEQEVQARLGVRDKMEGFGRRVIRDHMPEQHRAFYGALPFLMIGTVDAEGRPWASLVAGAPGFIASPDPRRLRVSARPLAGDPLEGNLRIGAEIGVLGIQLETRRRNRLSGVVSALAADGFEIAVRQSFGNCPQYIQARAVTFVAKAMAVAENAPHAADRLDETARALIERADTLFIATASVDGSEDRASGADVSHRGGKPGFVRVEDDRTLVLPDYSGNFHFNTIGNIALNPKAGLLFLDFESGTVLYLTGSAEVVWEGDEVRAFVGAERLLRFRTERMIRVEGSVPLRFRFGEYSPFLEATGTWQQALETIAANRARDSYETYEVQDVVKESESISSFHLRRADGKALATFDAGQFLPIRIAVPGRSKPAYRNYTISDAPHRDHYRISVKRMDDGGLVSNFLHNHVGPGFRLEAMTPRGKFVLVRGSDRPLVLISGGVGITPMIAITNHLINEGRRTRNFRRIVFMHGTTHGRALAFGRHLRALARTHESLTVHIRFSRPDAADRLGETHDSVGHVDPDLLKNMLPLDDCDVFLCGPAGFMQSVFEGLIGLGIHAERIQYESFGPATVLKRHRSRLPPDGSADGRVRVRFAASNVELDWSPENGTLLDLAEEAGLDPNFGCRSGICGTCATRILCGTVDYLKELVGPHGEDEVLICCATPRSTSGAETCGATQGIVLQL